MGGIQNTSFFRAVVAAAEVFFPAPKGVPRKNDMPNRKNKNATKLLFCEAAESVSYTHLTLPTNREV